MPLISTIVTAESYIETPIVKRGRGRPRKNPSPTLEEGESRTVKQSTSYRNFNHKPIRQGEEAPCLGSCWEQGRSCLPCSIRLFGRDQKGWPTLILKEKRTGLDVIIAEKPSFLPKRKPSVSVPNTPVVGTTIPMEIVVVDLMLDDDEEEVDLFS